MNSNIPGNEIKDTQITPRHVSCAGGEVLAVSGHSSSRGQAHHIWEKSVSQLAIELDPHIFSAYIKPLKLASCDERSGEFEVMAPSVFVRNHVDRNFRDRLIKALLQESGFSNRVNVKLLVAPTGQDPAVPQPIVVKKLPPAVSQPGYAMAGGSAATKEFPDTHPCGALNPRYTFQTFVVGNSNEFCHAAAQRVAENPGKAYNPLFIYGGVGLGKTHLLHAIGNAVLAARPGAQVVYMSSETFTNQLIQALRNSRMEEFKNRMRSINVLLIDDIQFMSGKERTQEEFFHTFNSLYNSKCQIVITSDRLPQDIAGIEERLHTRFCWGLTADIQSPDFETRVAILRRKAAVDGFEIGDDVAGFIAERISSNVRELEGALTRVHATSSLRGAPIDLALTESALKVLLQPKAVNISVDDIKKAVAEQFDIKVTEIISKRRTKNLSFPRHIAMYLCRKHTTCSYPEIGAQFGGRDHSSVIHASQVVSAKVSSDAKVKDLILQIEKRLLSN